MNWSYSMHATKCAAYIRDESGCRVASVSGAGRGRSEVERRARLLRSAPSSLETIKNTRDWLRLVWQHGAEPINATNATAEVTKEALAHALVSLAIAIDLAEGR